MRFLACITVSFAVTLALQSERTQINLSSHRDNATCEPCDDPNCWNCYSLDQSLLKASQLQSSVDVNIMLKTCSLKQDTRLQGVSEVAIVSREPVVIDCEEGVGLAVFDSSDIHLENLTFIGCSTKQYSTSRDPLSIPNQFSFVSFQSSIYFLSCRDITIKHVTVENSPGIAVVLYNTGGENLIANSTFSGNGHGIESDGQYGGGVIIEYSFCVPGDFKACKTPDSSTVSDAYFTVTDSMFSDNFAGATDYSPLHVSGSNYMGFGKGGGLSIVFKGAAQNNTVLLSKLKFTNNSAQFGGSLFVGFFDDAVSNSVVFEDSEVNSSKAFVSAANLDHFDLPQAIAEGGGTMLMYGSMGNSFTGESLIFVSNTAQSTGGSLSVHSTINKNTSQIQPSSLHLETVTIQRSSAKIGAGAYFISHYPLFIPIEAKVSSSNFTTNELRETCLSPGTTPCSATVYASNFPLHLYGQTRFTDNYASGLELHGSSVTFTRSSETIFERNTGEIGGGIIIADCGKMLIDSKASIMFKGNKAVYHGGGIYHKGCSGYYLNYPIIGSKECFVEHVNNSLLFTDKDISVTFDDNTANGKVNAIHTEALLSCVDTLGSQIQESAIANAFCGWNFKPLEYNCTSQVSSGVLYMEVKLPFENMMVFPGQTFKIKINAYNAYQGRIFERVKICVHEGQGSLYETALPGANCIYNTLMSSGDTPVTLFSQADKQKCETYAGKTVTLSVNVLSSPYPQAFVSVKIIGCPKHTEFDCPKCYLDVDQKHGIACANPEFCTLDNLPFSQNCPLTYSLKISKVHCWNFLENTNSSTSILSQFIGGKCPYNYRTKFCEKISDFTFQSRPAPCPANRAGRLCGRCDTDHGIAINTGDMECIDCHPVSTDFSDLLTFSYIAIELIYATILFLMIIIGKLSLNAGGTNAFIFYCQVLTMKYPGLSYPSWVLEKNYDDTYKYTTARGFTVIYSIANLDFIIPFAEPFCLSKNLTPIHAITLEYIPAIYLLLLTALVYIWVVLYKNHCNPIRLVTDMVIRKEQNSSPRSCCTYVPNYIESLALVSLLCYTRMATTSVKFLHSTDFYDLQGNKHGTAFFYDGTMDYFGKEHAVYAIIAISILGVFIFLPALALFFYPIVQTYICTRHSNGESSVKMYLQSFMGCFKDGSNDTTDHRYFAGIYLILRIVIAFLYLERDIETLLISQISVAIIAASLFMTLRPYKNDVFNTIDGLLFVYLALLSGLSANGYYSICQKFLIHIPLMIIVLYVFYKGLVLLKGIRLRRVEGYRTGTDNDDDDEPLLNPEENGDVEGAFAHRLLNPQDYSTQDEQHKKRKKVPLKDMSS